MSGSTTTPARPRPAASFSMLCRSLRSESTNSSEHGLAYARRGQLCSSVSRAWRSCGLRTSVWDLFASSTG
jgi:hypothetical protein